MSLTRPRSQTARALASAALLLGLSCVGLSVSAQAETDKPAADKPVADKPAPKKPELTCRLDEAEVPRGGRLDVSGEGFGQAPVLRIGKRIPRVLERRADRISVQVARDEDGGPVTVQADGQTATCGTLVIIGKNR